MIEMIVTLAIFSILVALTVPTMSQWIASTKVRAVADALQNGVRMAQTESLRRSRQVVFALTNSTNPLNDFTQGTLTAVTGDGGQNGNYWVIVTNPAMAGSSETPAFIASGVLTSAGSTVGIQGPAEICFNSAGRLVANSSTSIPGGTCQPTSATMTGGVPIYPYVVSVAGVTGGPKLNVNVAVGGQIRICDPSQTFSSTNPYGC